MYNISLNKKLYNLNNLCKIYYSLKLFKFYIFLDLFYFTNKTLLELKINLIKLSNQSLILNTKYITKLFDYKLCTFFGTKTLLICLSDCTKILDIINILGNKYFYFCYKTHFSNMISKNKFLLLIRDKILSHPFLLGLILFKLIMYIIIIILYLLYTLIKFIIC